MKTKKCSKCGNEKETNEFYFKKTEKRFNSWCKSCVYEYQRNRWRDRKRKAIELFGSKCQICGYNRNLSCFDFHHKDPNSKDMDWKRLRLQSWEKIVEELKKCVLVCSNCHREVHNPDDFLSESNGTDNKLLNIEHKVLYTERKIFSPTGKCPTCKKDVYGTKFCSVNCAAQAKRKCTRPRKRTLKRLLEESNYSAIGREYGVSDNAVRKWAKKYELI